MADESKHSDRLHRDPITLTRFILSAQRRHHQATGDFTLLLASIQTAIKVISNSCSKSGLYQITGVSGDSNSSGDMVKKLDVLSNDVFINTLTSSGRVCLLVSEENETALFVPPELRGKYVVCFDPLDGSSNIDANVAVGTIFSIYQINPASEEVSECDAFSPGHRQVCAGYAMYGAATMLVLTTGQGVNGFTLDPTVGEFILTHPDMKIPRQGKIYSVNEGNSRSWDAAMSAYVHRCKNPESGSPKSLRYIGSMVADVHRTLLYGGIFMYPADTKSPQGKLRLLYEANPMAFILEQAGGKASTGHQRILEVQPRELHQRVPVILGSYEDVEELERLYQEMGINMS
eukprot:TRINITY_DN1072_c0_g1_i1.p1 TRINITY_DN1072_c0_g1~~TRINITY_DN1072_c0_g1_i1.p1  ORF type:complete len:346 (+),score=108.06 TRINITY_DN1072_c0_g1_i1:67-1104(+)